MSPHVEAIADALVLQTGDDRIEPGVRVEAFSRDRAMRRYIHLFDQSIEGAAATNVGILASGDAAAPSAATLA